VSQYAYRVASTNQNFSGASDRLEKELFCATPDKPPATTAHAAANSSSSGASLTLFPPTVAVRCIADFACLTKL
ncbi:MAG: hypothetical protein ACKPKO_26665, partial [Candidatus Fonsibacter sp.]